ncbi:unnamed protein product [Symbiodinium sp. CCMP2592]|nr:unnamed protein product [Symbiodinium sp. CCMP2592]
MDFPSRNGSLGGRSDGKRMIVTKTPPARTDGQGEVNPMVDEADLVKEVVYSLLSAKGGATSTQQVQVAVNSSLIQIAKTNFPLVVAAVFSALETQKVSDQHKLQLLRLLCQVLETRRSDAEGKPCEVDRTLAKNLTRHLVAEVLVGAGDARQRAVADVLVELAPMHPDLVIGDLLAGIASSSAEKSEKEKLPVQLVQILSEVASTFPLSLRSRLDEVLTKYFALLQSCRGGDLPVLLLRAWCSLSVAMVCCATDRSEPLDVSDPTFTRDFAEASKVIRSAGKGGAARALPDDFKKAAQILGAVFALVMSAWPSWKDLNLRVAAVETLGHISLVIPKDQFLTNADSLLEHIASLLSRQGAFTTAASPFPPLRLLRGASLALQACIDADPEILTLESTLQTMLSSLFAWAALRGPLQEPGLSQEALQSQAELLQCFEILAECFASETFGFLLQKAKGSREERLASLMVLRHLLGGRAASGAVNIVEGIQQLLLDHDPTVGLMLGELLVAAANADLLGSGAAEAAKAAAKTEQVNNLINSLVRLTARSQVADTDQGYMPKFVSKGYRSDGPTAEEVRSRAGSIFDQLVDAAQSRLSLRSILWPLLLKALMNPALLPGMPVLCRTVSQLLQCARAKAEGDSTADDFEGASLGLPMGGLGFRGLGFRV